MEDEPVSITRYDKEEYNTANELPLNGAMEILCRLLATTENDPDTVYKHILTNVASDEIMLTSSQMHATNQDCDTF